MGDWAGIVGVVVGTVGALAALAAVYYARDTVREARVQRIEDGWRQVVADTVQLRRAAEAVLASEDAEAYHRQAMRDATSSEWKRKEGGPQVYLSGRALAEDRTALERAREGLEHSITGRYRTGGVLKLVKADPASIAKDAPNVIAEMREIQDKLRSDPGWWFRNPTPWHQRVRVVLIRESHRWVILPAIRLWKRCRGSVRRLMRRR